MRMRGPEPPLRRLDEVEYTQTAPAASVEDVVRPDIDGVLGFAGVAPFSPPESVREQLPPVRGWTNGPRSSGRRLAHGEDYLAKANTFIANARAPPLRGQRRRWLRLLSLSFLR